MMSRLLFIATIFASCLVATAFVLPTRHCSPPSRLSAKKKSKKASAGQGFGQSPSPKTVSSPSPSAGESSPLQSIETGASDAIPTIAQAPKKVETDPSLPPEERAKQVLREQYGLKTLEEQQTDQKKREEMAAARKQQEDWKKAAEAQDFDIMALIPGPVQVFIDRFLKVGVGICTVLFISAGIGITAEAWSKASGNPLPQDIDTFITTQVEPNFTPGLLVLLGFSVSLGVFSALQLSSAGAQYKEDK